MCAHVCKVQQTNLSDPPHIDHGTFAWEQWVGQGGAGCLYFSKICVQLTHFEHKGSISSMALQNFQFFTWQDLTGDTASSISCLSAH